MRRITHTEDSLKALAFARKNPGWNSYNQNNKRTQKAIKRLVELGRVEVNEFFQFRAKEEEGAS